jgi:hypothetical protein
MRLKIFYSYAHEDEALRLQLEQHLASLKREGLIEEFHDRCIVAGDDWRADIQAHARAADIFLLLVSSAFLASDFIYDVELKMALERHSNGEVIVIPVILREVDWSGAPFAHLQALPQFGKPVTSWSNIDEAFANIAHGIREIVERFEKIDSPTPDRKPIRVDREIPQSRFLDAAMPSHIIKDQVAELMVLVRLPTSAGLQGILLEDESSEARPEDVLSKDFKAVFPIGIDGKPEAVKAQVKITSPEFKPQEQVKQFFIPPDADSDVVSFFLTAIRVGKLKVLVELQWEDALRGTRRLLTECISEAQGIPSDSGNVVVRLPLEVKSPIPPPSVPQFEGGGLPVPASVKVPQQVPSPPSPLPSRPVSRNIVRIAASISLFVFASVSTIYLTTMKSPETGLPTPVASGGPSRGSSQQSNGKNPPSVALQAYEPQIVDFSTQQPLRNARVTLQMDDGDTKQVTTDDTGHIRSSIPAARQVVRAEVEIESGPGLEKKHFVIEQPSRTTGPLLARRMPPRGNVNLNNRGKLVDPKIVAPKLFEKK